MFLLFLQFRGVIKLNEVYLHELAKTIRSKNAGTDRITFDIIFEKQSDYELVIDKNVLTKSSVAELYDIDEGRITDFVLYDPAYAIKFTIDRTNRSGSPGDSDIFGSQQYAPLLDIKVPTQ